jgi:hypothetical protein
VSRDPDLDDDLSDDLPDDLVAALLAAAADPAGLAQALEAAGFGHLLVPVELGDLALTDAEVMAAFQPVAPSD